MCLKNIVGCCHNSLHPGKLTEKIMNKHECLKKNCFYFEKYPDSDYWQKQEQKKKEKQESREKQRAIKQADAAMQEEMEQKKQLLQSYITELDTPMTVIRVEKREAGLYKVLYVSDLPYNDENHYSQFRKRFKQEFPGQNLVLQHIRDINGHFVTNEEYRHRKR